MALTFLKQPISFGQSFAEGAGNSLQRLVSGRLQQLEQKNEQRDFAQRFKAAYPNVSDAEAAYVAGYPAEHRLKALEFFPEFGTAAPQQQEASESQEEPTIFSAAQKQREQELSPEQHELTKSDLSQLLKEHQVNQLGENLQIPKGNDLAKFAKSLGYDVTPEKRKQLQQKLDALKNNPELLQQAKQKYDQKVANNETIEIRKPGYTGAATPYNQAIQQPTGRPGKRLSNSEKLAAKKHEESLISDSFKMSQAERKEINDAGDAAEETRSHIKDLADLFKSGKLDTPGAMALLKDSGWPVDALQHPESAQAQNIIKSFLAGGPKLFGGKVSEGEMNVLLSAIPTLDTNPRGSLLMLETMDKYAARAEVKQKALKDLIKENGGKVPYGWREDLPDKVRPKYKQLEERYKNNIKKIGELKLKEESYSDTVLNKIYGEAIGAVGSAAKKAASAFGTAAGGAAAGAAVGSLVPGIGTAAGATAGGLIGGIGGLASDLLKR